MRMKTIAIALVAAAAAVGIACSKKPETPPTAGSGGSAAGSAAVAAPPLVIKPYTPAADVPDAIKAAIAAPDRTDKDRALDAGRKPAETFAFFKVAPGQKIGELFSGQGYSTELMARIVGPTGKVYAQNSTEMLEKFARKPLAERSAKPAVKEVIVLVEQPTETPFPPEAKDLDAVICIINYHDYVNEKVDRAKLNAAVLATLKPGGIYGIVDSSAAAGTGLRDTDTLHRIDEEVVKTEVIAAGFKLDGESDALRAPDDKRDWNTSPGASKDRRGTGDKFVLRFVKP